MVFLSQLIIILWSFDKSVTLFLEFEKKKLHRRKGRNEKVKRFQCDEHEISFDCCAVLLRVKSFSFSASSNSHCCETRSENVIAYYSNNLFAWESFRYDNHENEDPSRTILNWRTRRRRIEGGNLFAYYFPLCDFHSYCRYCGPSFVKPPPCREGTDPADRKRNYTVLC